MRPKVYQKLSSCDKNVVTRAFTAVPWKLKRWHVKERFVLLKRKFRKLLSREERVKSKGKKNEYSTGQKLFALDQKICRSLGSAASGCGGMGTDDTPIEGMGPSFFWCSG